jgi:hypothetical protein
MTMIGLDTTAITPVEYGWLQSAYDHFNADLFGGTLPNMMITLRARANTLGYYSHERFVTRDGKIYHGELALNPDAFTGRTDREICSTLHHEQHHVAQYAFGKPSRRGYHNRQWAEAMKRTGLYPSNTGAVGGKETGQQMSHYIIDGGPFDLSFQRLAATGWRLGVQSAPAANPKKPPAATVKYTCPGCEESFRGKRDPCVYAVCYLCERLFVPSDMTESKLIEAANRALAEARAGNGLGDPMSGGGDNGGVEQIGI